MVEPAPFKLAPLKQVPMSSAVVVAFGPNNSFFFSHGDTLIHHDCPGFMQHVFEKMAQPYKVALGPGTGDYACWYESVTHTRHSPIDYSWTPHFKPLRDRFNQLFVKEVMAYATVGFAVNASDAYVLTTPVSQESSGPVSTKLQAALTSRTKATANGSIPFYPDHVSLGVDDTWFIRWHDGVSAWDFGKGSYAQLSQLIGHQSSTDCPESVRRSIDYLVLDPWNPTRWLCVLDRGSRIEFSLMKKVADKIRPFVNLHLQDSATVTSMQDMRTMRTDVVTDAHVARESAPPAYR